MTAVQQGIPAEVGTYLGLHHIITLSTSSFTGMPHADTVTFASDVLHLYFFGMDDSVLARNIRDNRNVAFTVDDYTRDWGKVRELQGVGRCSPAAADTSAHVMMLMRNKFGPDFSRPEGTLYEVAPLEMHFVDYDYDAVADAPKVHRQRFEFGDDPVPGHGPVAHTLDSVQFDTGEVIFRPGEGAGDFYVVVEGEVEVRSEGHGADQTVVRVGSGEIFGDQATTRGQRGQLTAHATKPTRLLTVDAHSVRELVIGNRDRG